MFDRDGAVVAVSAEGGDVLTPVDSPQAGDDIPPPAVALIAEEAQLVV